MKINFNYLFYLVDYRLWFLIGVIGVIVLVRGIVKWFYNFNINLLILGYFIVILIIY